MNQDSKPQTKSKSIKFLFYHRLIKNVILGVLLLIISLAFGMWGYQHYAHMNMIDSYVNAAMILSGMGPIGDLPNEESKIFAGSYALFSGVVFLITVAIIISPVLHRFFHKLHFGED